MLRELKTRKEKERIDFTKAEEKAGRTTRAASIIQKTVAALGKDLGVDGENWVICIF